MACPGFNALYLAVKGQGAGSQPLDGDGQVKPIRINRLPDPTQARLCESVESSSTDHSAVDRVIQELGLIQPAVKLDSQAKYAAVAQGDADIYLRISPTPEYREKIWDHAAGVILVLEAGGIVTDLDGKPFDFAQGRSLQANQGVVVAVPEIHERVVAAVRSSR